MHMSLNIISSFKNYHTNILLSTKELVYLNLLGVIVPNSAFQISNTETGIRKSQLLSFFFFFTFPLPLSLSSKKKEFLAILRSTWILVLACKEISQLMKTFDFLYVFWFIHKILYCDNLWVYPFISSTHTWKYFIICLLSRDYIYSCIADIVISALSLTVVWDVNIIAPI